MELTENIGKETKVVKSCGRSGPTCFWLLELVVLKIVQVLCSFCGAPVLSFLKTQILVSSLKWFHLALIPSVTVGATRYSARFFCFRVDHRRSLKMMSHRGEMSEGREVGWKRVCL